MTDKQTRNRKTREQKLEEYKQHVARLEAAIAGKPDTTSENGIIKSLKSRLRKTQTELRAATIVINGQNSADGGVMRKPIADTIEATRMRLASQIETKERAELFMAQAPFSIEVLEATLASADQGDDVAFPTDLVRLTDEQGKTDEQHEAAAVVSQQDERADQEAIDATKRRRANIV